VGNLNNEIGLPLSLLELRHRPDVAVVELGMNHAGEISSLVRFAEPDVRVWTNVSEAHLGFFSSVDAIADAKAEILEGAEPSESLVANANDSRVMERVSPFAGSLCTFGIDVDAQVMATGVQDLGLDGTRARVTIGDDVLDVTVPLLGRANLSNALAAMAVGTCFDVPGQVMAETIATLRPASHRGEILRFGGVTVIDDADNSNPAALTATLRSLRSTSSERRVAVLGEMLELGDRSIDLHAACGREAVEAGVSRLITIGGAPAQALGQAAIEDGLPASAVTHVETSAEAADLVTADARVGDLILVKGSRGVRTDVVVERLREAAN
jgi:UDP-N-acetylmuramoyl-tripeptide--D-alanyl-D-alanine ligase